MGEEGKKGKKKINPQKGNKMSLYIL